MHSALSDLGLHHMLGPICWSTKDKYGYGVLMTLNCFRYIPIVHVLAAVAQSDAHLTGDHEVTDSIPAESSNIL